VGLATAGRASIASGASLHAQALPGVVTTVVGGGILGACWVGSYHRRGGRENDVASKDGACVEPGSRARQLSQNGCRQCCFPLSLLFCVSSLRVPQTRRWLSLDGGEPVEPNQPLADACGPAAPGPVRAAPHIVPNEAGHTSHFLTQPTRAPPIGLSTAVRYKKAGDIVRGVQSG